MQKYKILLIILNYLWFFLVKRCQSAQIQFSNAIFASKAAGVLRTQ